MDASSCPFVTSVFSDRELQSKCTMMSLRAARAFSTVIRECKRIHFQGSGVGVSPFGQDPYGETGQVTAASFASPTMLGWKKSSGLTSIEVKT